MKLYVFTKKGLLNVCVISLILSAYVSVIIMNFASREMSIGNLVATLAFVVALGTLSVLTQKKHPLLHKCIGGWLIANLVVCVLGVMLSLLKLEFSGFAGSVVGVMVMLFISPYYGFGYVFNNGFTVSLLGALCTAGCLLLPGIVGKSLRRRKLAKKYS